MTNKRLNISSNILRFNIFADWKIFKEEFELWPTDPFSNMTFVTVCIHITNLSYLEDRSPHFSELLNSGIEELNRILVGLDTAAIISGTNNQDLPD